jgi:hypothetical protein
VIMVLGHVPAAAVGGAAETTVGGVVVLLDEPLSLHPVALTIRVIRMISKMAAKPIVRLLCLRMMSTLLLLSCTSQFHFRRNYSALFGN